MTERPSGPKLPPPPPVELPVTWRPLGPRIVGVILGVGLLVLFASAWLSFDDATKARFTLFQDLTMLALGALGFSCLYALLRSRVVATRERLVVVNGFRRHEYEWAQVVAVHLPPGAPWVTLDLADGTTASALGIQGSDGARAQRAARQLRSLANQLTR